jgi:hypothetical protein
VRVLLLDPFHLERTWIGVVGEVRVVNALLSIKHVIFGILFCCFIVVELAIGSWFFCWSQGFLLFTSIYHN